MTYDYLRHDLAMMEQALYLTVVNDYYLQLAIRNN